LGQFADTSWYYGYNTVKVSLGFGLVFLGATLFERFTRWAFRTARGTYEYWHNEYKDAKYQGNDPALMDLENDPFVNDTDGWESPVIEKRYHLMEDVE
jgi:hypothetical protein